MLEEAAVLGRQHRLDDMVGHLVDRHGVALDDAALADLVAVAVEEGDGEIVLRAPVAGGFLEGRHGQRQHHDGAGRAHGEAFAQQLDDAAPPAGDAEAAEEDGQVFPGLARLEAGLVERRIDPRVDRQQPVGFRDFRLAWLDWTFHSGMRPAWAKFLKTMRAIWRTSARPPPLSCPRLLCRRQGQSRHSCFLCRGGKSARRRFGVTTATRLPAGQTLGGSAGCSAMIAD